MIRKFVLSLIAAVTVVLPLSAEDRIDILVVYTPAVKDHFGGATGVEAQLLAVFAASNEALENSQIDAVYNLLGPAEVNYVETDDLAIDLDRLEGTSDGFMDEIHALRDDYGADLVALMRRDAAGGFSGLANVPVLTSGQSNAAFSVFDGVDGLSNFVFAHEIGHNLGLAHAFGEAGSDGLRDFARGWRFNGNSGSHRTIMATTSGFTRIPHYSNPNVLFDGASTGDVGVADAARALALFAPVAEAYRAAQPAAPEFFGQPTDRTVVRGQTAHLNALVNGLPPLDLQWFEGERGDVGRPLAGGTASRLVLDSVDQPQTLWLQAANADGMQESRTSRIQVVDAPVGPFSVVEELPAELASTGFRIDRAHFQQVVFSGGYVDSIEAMFFRAGSPGNAVVRLLDRDGSIVFQGTLVANDVNSSVTTITFPVRAFVEPGEVHRFEVAPENPEQVDGNNRINWRGGDSDGSDGLESSINSRPGWQFSFLARGRSADTFTAWLDREGIAESFDNSFDSTAGDTGLPLGVLYATGQQLNATDPAALPQVSVDGDDFVLRFRVLADAIDVVATPQGSSALDQFADSAVTVTPVANNDPSIDAFEVRVPIASLSVPEADRFFRLAYRY